MTDPHPHDPAAWGIDPGWWDVQGTWHEPDRRHLAALLEAAGEDPSAPGPPPGPPLWSVRAGRAEPLHSPAELVLEDGTVVRADDALPADLPIGYHQLVPLDGGPTTRLIVSPGRCHLPADLRVWGWAVQLYAARSAASWGIGDLGDLAGLGRWSAGLGAGVLAINPLHAAAPAVPQQPSPYYPTSRRWRNPLFLHIADVPGAALAAAELEALDAAGRALNDGDRIDRDKVFWVKAAALDTCWRRFQQAGGDRDFDRFVAGHAEPLATFARFCAIAERHGGGWRDWPAELRHPASAAVARLAEEHADRVRHHQWLQWVLDRQLASAAGEATGTPLLADLAVGFDPGGADAWAWQDLLALDARVGAPPDDFNADGQDWGLPPFVPWRLRAAGHEPFIETVRSAFRHAGALRVDHVMGLFRLFWIPPGGSPSEGTYVRYPAGELLDILAIESVRAGAFVVGEDLGTVEPGVREDLAERNVLSYRLLWFEPDPPDRWPEHALAAVTTHDLPTVAGAWTGADVEAQRSIGLAVNEGGAAEMRERLVRAAQVGGLDGTVGLGADDGSEGDGGHGDGSEEVGGDGDGAGRLGDDADAAWALAVAAHRALAAGPCRVVLATLDDAVGAVERPNMPGTVDEWPNWSIPLPRSIEQIEDDPQVRTLAQALRRKEPPG